MIYELMVLWQLVFLPVERYCGKYAVRCTCVCLTNCPGHNSHEELIKGRISEIGAEVVFRGCCFGSVVCFFFEFMLLVPSLGT